jgi:hypothetical protein
MSHQSKPIRLWWDWEDGGFAGIEFRPLGRGFSVWLTQSETWDALQPHRIDSSPIPFTWRSIAERLAEGRDGLSGGLFFNIRVSGVLPWQADILLLCLHGEDYDYERERELLLSLPDKEIRKIWLEEKSLVSEFVLNRLHELNEHFQEHKLEGMSLAQVSKRVSVPTSTSVSDLIKALSTFKESKTDDEK